VYNVNPWRDFTHSLLSLCLEMQDSNIERHIVFLSEMFPALLVSKVEQIVYEAHGLKNSVKKRSTTAIKSNTNHSVTVEQLVDNCLQEQMRLEQGIIWYTGVTIVIGIKYFFQ